MEDTSLIRLALGHRVVSEDQVAVLRKAQTDLADHGLTRGLWHIACDRGIISETQERALRQELSQVDRQARIIGGYRFIRRLGKGGMGEVFLAEGPDHRRCAVKLLPESHAQDSDAVQRFHREAQAVLMLESPHIVRGLATGTDQGRSYLVMESVEGPSLKDRIKGDKLLSPPEVLALLVQVSLGLRHAWRCGVLHRDVKPGNIMLDGPRESFPEPFCAKVCDFGLARTNHIANDGGAADMRSQPGMVLGTPLYMSPEQAQGSDDLEQRADIFGLAATVYHAVVGRPVQTAEDTNSLLWRRVNEDICLKALSGTGLPDGILSLLSAMLERQRSRRIQDWDWVIHACRRADPTIVDPLLAGQAACDTPTPRVSFVGDEQRRYSELASSRIDCLASALDTRLGVMWTQPEPSLRELSAIRRDLAQIRALAQNLEVLAHERPVQREPMDLRRLALEVSAQVEGLPDRAPVTITVEGEGTVVGDRAYSRLALLNLMRNGVLACRSEGQVRIRMRDGLLVVADEGHGIPARVLANLFEATSPERVFGLGATVARTCQRRQGGDVRLLRTGQHGTAFGMVWAPRTATSP
jgi:serine/threonine protein kinase